MNIKYSTDRTGITPDKINALYGGEPFDSALLDMLFARSSFVASAWDGDKMVGYVRILSDGYWAIIYGLSVHADYRGKGIGATLINMCSEWSMKNNIKNIILFYDEDNSEKLIPFYEKLGFKIINNAMIKTLHLAG